jgi:haloalkane dehalogenase
VKNIEVEGSVMAYREAGAGDTTIVFLHGNPTSSHMWRNVIPVLADRARCLAPDLIGMGDSGKPDIGYRFVDHVRYLDAWFDALGLDDVVIVGQDWGGALGMDWARRHPDRVRGLALIETFLRPLSWAELPPLGQDLFRRMRSAEGEQMVLRDNQFIEFNLPHGVQSGLSEADHDEYRRPYPDERSRRPLLAWPREIPFDGEPADVHDRVVAYGRWLAETPAVPKLVMTVENGVGMGSAETATWAKETFAATTVVSVGPAGHQAPEDQPEAIGLAIASWLWA